MDEFAQTRAPDDLFDDDFTPITEPVVEAFVQPRPPQSHRGRGDRSRGRGGRAAPPQQQQQQQHNTPNQPPAKPSIDPSTTTTNTATEAASTELDPAPKAPSAVRGDRSATGGNAKPKLTEEELSARLAAAKLNNARREEAHRLAEADEASFQQREAQASQRRQEEGRARRLMDQERERNRLRKLGAQGGREWDEGKEDQPVDTRRSRYQRGAHGGTANYHDGAPGGGFQADEPDLFSGRDFAPRGGRGRGGRDRGRGGRGRGRGGFENTNTKTEILQPPVPNAATDFPALPPATAPKLNGDPSHAQSKGQQQSQVEVPSFQSPIAGGQSWADEVEGKAA
ncbi:MAG: hypothetical protein Q9220_000533 [cf. Caloplaca sp. 1 TL-2023]